MTHRYIAFLENGDHQYIDASNIDDISYLSYEYVFNTHSRVWWIRIEPYFLQVSRKTIGWESPANVTEMIPAEIKLKLLLLGGTS